MRCVLVDLKGFLRFVEECWGLFGSASRFSRIGRASYILDGGGFFLNAHFIMS